ncbi:SSI family serine proteinase inhibitor [Streptosporangium sp. NPDC000239]|uniref:SSI family serine proteinase inhibitor n=1 Tax=Streptosporangium sp. NPDC000239 TaxID=3154248 RepID=UPI003328D575
MRTVKIVSAVLTFAAAAAPSALSGAVSGTLPASAVVLSLSVGGGPARSVLLRCGRAESRPSFTTACGMLGRFGGDLARMTYDVDRICGRKHVAHAVSASGTWEGRPVRFEHTYDNRCEMTALTGPVFSF